MSWRIAIAHTTTHSYAQTVSASYNEARVVPRTLARQSCLETRVEVHPGTRTYQYADYWGSIVTAFDIHAPHTEMTVESVSVVETSPPPAHDHQTSWSDVSASGVNDTFAELMTPTPYTLPDAPAIHALCEELRTLPSPHEAAHQAVDWVRSRVRYATGATDVLTSASEALAQGEGVCQDFAHVTLAVLRELGIPARYVSGYLHPSPDASVGETVTGQSHAWVEWWCGDWTAWDPTHGVAIGERHVLVARGRDYADVPPLKGVYHGAPAVAHVVTVQLTRLG